MDSEVLPFRLLLTGPHWLKTEWRFAVEGSVPDAPGADADGLVSLGASLQPL